MLRVLPVFAIFRNNTQIDTQIDEKDHCLCVGNIFSEAITCHKIICQVECLSFLLVSRHTLIHKPSVVMLLLKRSSLL